MHGCVALISAVCALLVAPRPAPAQLDYVDSSSGLQTPQMEGGNTELEFGDLDGDGHVDIAMIGDHGSPFINSSEHGITVWFGDGTGNWSVYQNGNFGYGGIALGDVNNDGLMDAGYGMHHDYSSTDFGDQLLEVALGNGTGQNWTPWDDGLATMGEDWGMFGTDFADVDNDGDLDVGSVSFGCCAGIHVYRNNGDGTWTQSYGFTGGNSNMVFAFGDVNGDGHADFAAAHGTGTIWLGDGTGSFTQGNGNLPSSSTGLRGVALGDVTDDGCDDLAFVNGSGGLDVWTWIAPSVWQEVSGALPASGSFDLAQIADMDLDGHGDVVAFASGNPGLLRVYAGDGAGRWTQVASVSTPNCCDDAALRAGTDADHNGYPDVVLVSEENCAPWVGGTNRPRFYAESSTPTGTWIHPQRPRGGETLIAGSARFVDWTAAVSVPGQPTIAIDLSLVGPSGPWIPLAAALPDNGRFQWLLPADLPTSSTCRLRFTLNAAGAATSQSFTILGGAAIGDHNDDGSVDVSDFAEFPACMTGPDAGPLAPGCDVFDVDLDDDVDMVDFGAFQQVFTGPA
ncbi:MAG: VCBS repeat-containing protein [Phycisphaerales bacterium]|nr:MAG: VCBS repeat-containing protein [Phycisphaerales bacterium]